MRSSSSPYLIERILAAATYLSAGFIGAVWLIIAAVTRKQVTGFVMYHIFQSIFLSIAYYLLTVFGGFLILITARIPLINQIPLMLNSPLPIFFSLSIIQIFTTFVLVYLVISSFLGLYSYIPWVSDIIKTNTRH